LFFRSIFVLLLPNYNLGQYFFIKMKRITTQKKITTRKLLLLALLLAVSSLHGFAQGSSQESTELFYYEDDGKTIVGLTEAGQGASTLIIPANVTSVIENAFSTATATSIDIDDANVSFDVKAFEGVSQTFSDINMGKKMSNANMRNLLKALGTNLAEDATIEIEGLDNCTNGIIVLSDLSSNKIVKLPAALVREDDEDTFNFGNAQVYGRFDVTRELITFCGNVTFLDDGNSNMLFYVADSFDKEKGSIHIQRVFYIKNGAGVLIHRADDTSYYAELKRVSDGSITSAEKTLYGNNMLKGVVVPTTIGATEEEGTYTNMVLYNGSFIRTSGGTLGANRAYLRILTEDLTGVAANAKLGLSYGNDEATGIANIDVNANDNFDANAPMYNLAGQKVSKSYKGIVIQNGKKYVAR